MMYYNIKLFGKEGGSEYKYLEFYFYDDDLSFEYQYYKCREKYFQKDKEVIKQIVGIFYGNLYSEYFRSMGYVENFGDYYIVLNFDQILIQKIYITFFILEVVTVWIEGSER